jgi:hypothetical protein
MKKSGRSAELWASARVVARCPHFFLGREVRLADPFSAPEIAFAGEDDGSDERRLKEALDVLLRLNRGVSRAYLFHDGNTGGVTLGVLTDDEKENEKLAEQVNRAFAALFNTASHLGIRFLSSENEAEIRKIMPPFYDRRAVRRA